MSGAAFHQTRMGQRYYEHTLPELVRQLTRLNVLLERTLSAQIPTDPEEPPRPETES